MKRKRSENNNEKLLVYATCKYENCQNTSVSVHGKNPYCRKHTTHLCCMSSEKNIFNEVRCNSVVQMVECDNKMYCNAHYRSLIQMCNHNKCTKSRTNRELCYDKKWYCKKHRLDTKKFHTEMVEIFDKLNSDVVEKICKIHFKRNTYVI